MFPRKNFYEQFIPDRSEVFSINRIGLRIPFKHLDGKFVVSEGKEKIDVIQEKKDKLMFKTKNSSGRLIILYYARNVAFPVEIILNIEGASLAVIKGFKFSSI